MFNEKEEAYKLAIFLKHQCRINDEELEELIRELFEARNNYGLVGMEIFFDNMLYERSVKAYKYVALQKLNEFLMKVKKIRDYDFFRKLRKAMKNIPELKRSGVTKMWEIKLFKLFDKYGWDIEETTKYIIRAYDGGTGFGYNKLLDCVEKVLAPSLEEKELQQARRIALLNDTIEIKPLYYEQSGIITLDEEGMLKEFKQKLKELKKKLKKG